MDLGIRALECRVAHAREADEDVARQLVAEGEAAQRIVDVLLHFGRIAAQPLEACGAAEGLVEVLEEARPYRRVAEGLWGHRVVEHIDQLLQHRRTVRRAAQHQRVEQIAAALDVVLRHERAEAVAEQHELGTGMRGAQALREGDFVFDHPVPGIGAGIAGAARAQPRAAVTAMVGAVDRIAARDGRLRETTVAAGVLGCAVHDLQHCLRCRAGRYPTPVVDSGAVAGGELLPVSSRRPWGGTATEGGAGGKGETSHRGD